MKVLCAIECSAYNQPLLRPRASIGSFRSAKWRAVAIGRRACSDRGLPDVFPCDGAYRCEGFDRRIWRWQTHGAEKKHVFQMNSVDMGTGVTINVQIKRAKVVEQFANHASCVVVIEACGGAHRWARTLSTLSHTVRLLHAKIVRTFVSGNKTDATDARAIWLSVQQPGVKFVGTKMSAQR